MKVKYSLQLSNFIAILFFSFFQFFVLAEKAFYYGLRFVICSFVFPRDFQPLADKNFNIFNPIFTLVF